MLWHTLNKETIWRELQTSPKGLEAGESLGRLKKFGQNTLPSRKRRGLLHLLLDQVANPLIGILLVALTATLFLRDHEDALVIAAAVVINVFIGLIQEYKAEKSLAELRSLLAPKARVRREDHEREIAATEVVPGDILILHPGDHVAADARVIESFELEVNEATLTGESVPVVKTDRILKDGLVLAERKNMIYTGTVVVAGEGEAVAVATGLETELGSIAKTLRELPDEPTPLQKKLTSLSWQIGALVLLLSAILLVVGLSYNHSLLEMFLVAVALAVAAIPEGLVVAVTAILAVGMRRLLAKQALVRKLVAAETLGATTVICTDKTGTLTEGEMRAVKIITEPATVEVVGEFLHDGWPLPVKHLLETLVLGTNAVVEDPEAPPEQWKILGTFTERALLQLVGRAGLRPDILRQDFTLLDDLPFTSTQKFQATLRRHGESHILHWVGAPDRLIMFCDLTPTDRASWLKRFEALAGEGYRLVGVARRAVHTEKKAFSDLGELKQSGGEWLGVVALRDPVRTGMREVLDQAARAGITTVMVTGDHPATAYSVAKDLGLAVSPTQVLSGDRLSEMSEADLVERVRGIRVYARVSPEDKLKIVGAWQALGEVVAMTGDGVNDTPALSKADIGIAVGTGTDLAKETADLVLLDNNFQTIVEAVKEGRVIYDNIRKVALYLLADSFAGVVLIAVAIIIGLPLPLLATQILWLNMIGDGLPAVALTLDPADGDVLARRPVRLAEPILNRSRLAMIAITSLVIGLGSLLIFKLLLGLGEDVDFARTLTFAIFGSASLWYVFTCRNREQSILSSYFWSNTWLILAVALSFGLLVGGIYLPVLQALLGTVALPPASWGIVLGFSLVLVAILEMIKWWGGKLRIRQVSG